MSTYRGELTQKSTAPEAGSDPKQLRSLLSANTPVMTEF